MNIPGAGGQGLKGLLKDKKFVGVVAVGALVGAYALSRNRAAGDTSGFVDGAGVAGSGGSAGSGTPTFNDGGSDIAASLGNFSVELQGILQNYADSLKPTPIPPKTTTPKAPTPADNVAARARAAAEKARREAEAKKKSGKPAPAKTFSYKIRRGDTLSQIAQKNHTTVGAIAKLNGIKNVNLIYAGRTITVPKSK